MTSVCFKFEGDDRFNASEVTVMFRVLDVQSPGNDTNSSSGNGTGNNDTNVTIDKLDCNLSVKVSDVDVGDAVVFNVSVDCNVTGRVVVSFNGVEDVVGVSGGKGTYSIPGLAVGNYSAVVKFEGDDRFNASEVTVMFRVLDVQSPGNDTISSSGNGTGNSTENVTKPVKTSLSASSLTTVYNGGKYVVVTLMDSSNKPIAGAKVSVRFSNGKVISSKTDSKGKAKFTTDGLIPVKTYTATITFAGNANYLKSTKTVKVAVKKATPKLVAKAKTLKLKDKTKKYTVAFKTNRNKVLKNKWVSIKVNNKKYSVQTNSKGVAIFKLTKLVKKGKYTAKIKYAGSKYYTGTSTYVKITVK